MIEWVDNLLSDYGQYIHKLGSGFPPDSLSAKIAEEGEGASIRGGFGSGLPIPFHKIIRRFIKLHKVVGELPEPDQKLVEITYKIYIDPVTDSKPRWELLPYSRATYFRKLDKVHIIISEEIINIAIEA